MRRAALPWLLLLYGAASLLHFSHNAQSLEAYPNLPASWTPGEVYATWGAVSALGALGFLLYRSGRSLGLWLMGLYAVLGCAGLLHYTRAPFSHHTTAMNATIWAEALAGALLLLNVLRLGSRRAS